MPSLNINDGGTWKQPREIHCREFEQWFPAKEVYVNDNGTWVKVWGAVNQLQNFAEGGQVEQIGNYRVHIFTLGEDTFDLQETHPDEPIEYLVVGGGGAGGVFVPSSTTSFSAGGGGGGEVIIGTENLPIGQYSVIVGEGGVSSFTEVTSGQASQFNGIMALGGGSGAGNYYLNGSPPPPPSLAAASGGGGSTLFAGTPHTPDSGHPAGSFNMWGAGGGGGASGPGADGGGTSIEDSFSGDGGSGVIIDFFSAPVGFGGGGAGISIGDLASTGRDGGGDANEWGRPNTGGGGGAMTNESSRGGSGIVVVRYLYNVVPSFLQSPSLSHSGGVSAGTEISVQYIEGPSSPPALPYYRWVVGGVVKSSAESYVVESSDYGQEIYCVVRLENRIGYDEQTTGTVTVSG